MIINSININKTNNILSP